MKDFMKDLWHMIWEKIRRRFNLGGAFGFGVYKDFYCLIVVGDIEEVERKLGKEIKYNFHSIFVSWMQECLTPSGLFLFQKVKKLDSKEKKKFKRVSFLSIKVDFKKNIEKNFPKTALKI